MISRRKKGKKSGSKTLRTVVRVKVTDKTALRLRRALKKVGIPSSLTKLKGKRYLDLRPSRSTRKIIKRNIALRKIKRVPRLK